MPNIVLPSKSNDDKKSEDIDKKSESVVPSTGIDQIQNQMSQLAEQVGELNRMRRAQDEQRMKEIEAEKETELEAEADLKALLNGGMEDGKEDLRGSRIDDLTNSELLNVVSSAVETAIDARIRQSSQNVDKKIKEISDSTTKIYQVLGKMQAAAGIQSARDKYKDFDKFKDDTMAVLDRYPMMEIEDAYLLGRQLRAGNSPPAKNVASERPIVTPFGAFSGGADRKDPTNVLDDKSTSSSHGIVGFRNILDKAIDKVLTKYEGR